MRQPSPARARTLHGILDDPAPPHAPALVCGRHAWDFGELRERVEALARGIAARTAPGDRVAVLAHNRAEYVLAYYAVPRAGRVLVPLNPRLHPAEWAEQLARAGARLLLAEGGLAERLPPAESRHSVPRVLFDGPDWDTLLSAPPPPGGFPPDDPDRPAWLLFTSGSTGRPKGVRLTHRSLLAAVRSTRYGRPVDRDAVFLTPFPLCHVAGYQVLMHHQAGRPAVVMRRFEPDGLLDLADRHRVTSLSLAPTMIDALLDHLAAAPPERTAALRATVRTIGYGSSPISPRLLRRCVETLDCDLNQGYGSTELSGNAVFLGPAEHRAAAADPGAAAGEGRGGLLGAAGRPAPGVELRIVDPWDEAGLTDRPPGAVGELAVRAEQLCDGYWDDPSATAAAFRSGWFRTGDLARIDEAGYLHLTDRKKDVIVTGGENVSAREVEAVLLEHPAVDRAAVVGVPDPRWGERVCAVLVPVPAPGVPSPDPDELTALCRGRLAGFKVPRRVVLADALPLTGTGKVAKGVLRERLAAAGD
ncbi:class I adenylate-forming enzyme family protein [Phaeacidiphilus oryzae]|uniref:class I adenylate-forming enzyme family protein n=1 Tax=Phaeacidiphilus oryzae TaxID=348818 RepID=UPI00056BBA08|nr:AMP-binding protein [Phaeacidiphilus oryzae]